MTTLALNDNQIAQLFHAHHEAIVAYLARRGCSQETAEDIGQETYLRLLSKSEVAHDDNLKAYLFRIAEHLAIDYFRQNRQAKNNTTPLNDDLLCPKLLPDEVAALRQQCEQLIYAIELLPASVRNVFLLRKIDELSYAEISQRLGISEKTVQRHLVNAMLHCHQCLQP